MKRVFVVISLFFLASCAATPVAIGLGVITAASIGYISLNDKGPLDPVISLITKKDCNIVRMDRDRGDYCRDFDQDVKLPSTMFKDKPVWCYRELSKINCYTTPDSDNSRQVVYYHDPDVMKKKLNDYWIREKQKQVRHKDKVLGRPAKINTRAFNTERNEPKDEQDENVENVENNNEDQETIDVDGKNQNEGIARQENQQGFNDQNIADFQKQNQIDPPLDSLKGNYQEVLNYKPEVEPAPDQKDLKDPSDWQKNSNQNDLNKNNPPYDLAPSWLP